LVQVCPSESAVLELIDESQLPGTAASRKKDGFVPLSYPGCWMTANEKQQQQRQQRQQQTSTTQHTITATGRRSAGTRGGASTQTMQAPLAVGALPAGNGANGGVGVAVGGVPSSAQAEADSAGEDASSELPFFLGLGLVCALGVLVADFVLTSSAWSRGATGGEPTPSLVGVSAPAVDQDRGAVYGLLFSFLGGAHSLHKGTAGRSAFLWLTAVAMLCCVALEVAVRAGWVAI
jgi:hypothetical protein